MKKIDKNNTGNDKWEGHYAIDTRGGTQKGEVIGCEQLANNIIDYSSEDMCKIIKYQMVYYMFFLDNAVNLLKKGNKNDIEIYKLFFRTFCRIKNIQINSYLNYENKLSCCISLKPITFEDFQKGDIQLCHIEPVTKFKILYDDKQGIVTAHNYSNLAWGFKSANIMQCDNTIKDTKIMLYDIIIRDIKNIRFLTEKEKNTYFDNILEGLEHIKKSYD